MFLGQYERTLDDKGRLVVPADFRPHLGAGSVLTRSFDNCLCIYPAAKWQALAQAIDDLPEVRSEARALARALSSYAVRCELDRQGRLSIPAFLREYAAITGEAVVVGALSRVEIWSQNAWRQEQERVEARPRLAEALAASGV